jgi:hypothetical protein
VKGRAAHSFHVRPADTRPATANEVKSMNAEEYFRMRCGTEAAGLQDVRLGKTWDCYPASRGLLGLQSGTWTADRVPQTYKTSPFADLPSWAQPKWMHPGNARLL